MAIEAVTYPKESYASILFDFIKRFHYLLFLGLQPLDLNPACGVDWSRRSSTCWVVAESDLWGRSSKSEVGSPKGGAPNPDPIRSGEKERLKS